MTPEEKQALLTARGLLDVGHPLDRILETGLIAPSLHAFVRAEIQRDANILLRPARVIVQDNQRVDWLRGIERGAWTYWPSLRQFLLTGKHWPASTVRSVDDASDQVLRLLPHPTTETFDTRGLVLGFVQSGKTANFTALCAKAADVGYRLIIVLSGIDNGLRLQTNIRLRKELVGVAGGGVAGVTLPPVGKQWHEFTRPELHGDFSAGQANHAALQGSQPVLMVVKKNGAVLRRLLNWLEEAPGEILRAVPTILVDDEADLASVDTKGSYQTREDPDDPDYEPPSAINGLVRDLLSRFGRRAYVAYTATPFANVLIPHDTTDPSVGNDLYPKDFIVDLPKPDGYFGAQEIFGMTDPATGEQVGGLDCIREVSDQDVLALESGGIPKGLTDAIAGFVLAAAARRTRSGEDAACTMLVHTSPLIAEHGNAWMHIDTVVGELRDEWRYHRSHGILERLRGLWEAEFRRVTRASHIDRDVPFETIEPQIGPVLEAMQVREVNSRTGAMLDYEREPFLKAVAVGGNRLSRGLTLEGLLVSYFVRRSATYDTLMQMGRWFGFRSGHEDLTRIHTTRELAGWFSDLAVVESRLRADIKLYEEQGLTPYQVGVRVWQHPAMQVTSPLKRRFASNTLVAQDYQLELEQTFRFPLSRLDDLATQAEANIAALRRLSQQADTPDATLAGPEGPVWSNVPAELVLNFLSEYQCDGQAKSLSLPLLRAYIERAAADGDLVRWVVAVRGLSRPNKRLGVADWGLPTGPVSLISRSRLGFQDSIGALVGPSDEGVGLKGNPSGRDARAARSSEEGLLLLYPISRQSGQDLTSGNRKPLYAEPNGPQARDLLGLALSFPRSRRTHKVEAYLKGTAPEHPPAPEWVPEE